MIQRNPMVQIPSKVMATPLVGAKAALADRNFYITDNLTYIEWHFCLSTDNAIPSGSLLFELPSFAHGKDICFTVAVESNTGVTQLVYNWNDYIYLGGSSITASTDGVFVGTLSISLL